MAVVYNALMRPDLIEAIIAFEEARVQTGRDYIKRKGLDFYKGYHGEVFIRLGDGSLGSRFKPTEADIESLV